MIKLNLEKINTYVNQSNIQKAINAYHNYCDCNSFNDLCCPNCSSKQLTRHSNYQRNYVWNNTDCIINITVLKCGDCQKHHALLPSFIVPYHVYSPFIIFRAIKKDITFYRQLLLYWNNKFNDYLKLFNIVFATNDTQIILSSIVDNYFFFYERFWDIFKHIFFLSLNKIAL